MAKVTQTYFVLFTFLTIVKWFRDVTDSVWHVTSVSVTVKCCCWLGVDVKSNNYVLTAVRARILSWMFINRNPGMGPNMEPLWPQASVFSS
jgi:hypothetical protein